MLEKSRDIIIVDYGLGNLFSVTKAIEKCGYKPIISSNSKVILNSSKIVLPGVGSFSKAMQELKKRDLIEIIKMLAMKGVPILSICLGMQLLLDESEENGLNEGLSLIQGRVTHLSNFFNTSKDLKIPHIGWSAFECINEEIERSYNIIHNISYSDYFYFVHSFHAVPSNPENIVAKCSYGNILINSIIQKDNIIGCQFHPEKSGESGLKLIKNFCKF